MRIFIIFIAVLFFFSFFAFALCAYIGFVWLAAATIKVNALFSRLKLMLTTKRARSLSLSGRSRSPTLTLCYSITVYSLQFS